MADVIDGMNRTLRRLPVWPIYAAAALWPAWLLWQGVNGALGVDPVKVMEHALGEKGLQMLILGLTITPMRRYMGLNLLKFRRAIGLVTFWFILLHLCVWLILDLQSLAQIWADILKRPYITLGMTGFVLMIPLAITSNNMSVRRMGATWRRLHRLVYPVAILGSVHFLMLVKGFQWEPILYLVAILALLGLRLPPRRRPRMA